MMKKIFSYASMVGVFVFSLLISAQIALAAPSSTPTEVLGTMGDAGINSGVDIGQYVVVHYFGYGLVAIAVVGIFFWMKRLARAGTR